MLRNRWLLVVTLAAVTFSPSCGRRPRESSARYPVKGKVVSVDRDNRRVTLAHEEIPGFMPAMTMPFAIREEWPFRVLVPGQQIMATLVVDSGRTWLEEITVTQESAGGPATAPAATNLPAAGAEVPDFTLTNQSGRRLHLRQYRGKALLLTFIYTRCPLPDYCPRMSGNFARIHAEMRKDADLSGRLHLLSVSFDPEHDTGEVLQGYGKGYVGTVAGDPFRDWEFATGTPAEIKAITSYFGLEYWPDKNQFTHSLRTALIGPDGALVRVYPGNEWTPADVLRDLRSGGGTSTQPPG
jgi:protein SCO1/2